MSKKNEKEKKTKKKEDKTKSKKNLIIIILSIVVVILLCVVGWFIYRNSLENKTTGSTWSDKYYEFLKKQSKAKKTNPSLGKESDISFVQTKSMKDPMMIVEYKTKQEGKDFEGISVFAIIDNSVKYLGGQTSKSEEVKLYYDINKKEYKYYIHGKNDNFENFVSLDTLKYDYDNYNVPKLMEEKGITDYNSDEYKTLAEETAEKQGKDENREQYEYFADDNKVTQQTLDGKTLEYNKVDEKLVDVNVKPKTFDYKQGMDPVKMRDEVVEGKDDYKEINNLLNKAIEKVVKEQIELVEKVKQDIENAKNEIKADEEKKAREKEEREGFKIGSYTLKYGRYEWDLGELGDYGRKEVYILNSDKTCTHIDYDGNSSSCTFRAGRATDGQSIESAVERDALIINDNTGGERSYFPKTGGFRDTDLENFLYKGAN